MASLAQWSPVLGRSATVRSVVVAAPRPVSVGGPDGPVIDPRGTATIVRENAAVPRTRSPVVTPKADIPEVGAPSQCPHAEQNARWSAVSCAQCLQVRMAVESLLYPWYRFGHERRRQDELPAHRED